MLEPNERLKRVFQELDQTHDKHIEEKDYYNDQLDDETMHWGESTLDLLNYFYHLGASKALGKIRHIFLHCWGGTEEEWFKLIKKD